MASHSKRKRDKANKVLLPNDARLASVDARFAAENAYIHNQEFQSHMRASASLIRTDVKGTVIPDDTTGLPQSRKPRDKRTAFNVPPIVHHPGGFTSRKVN